MTREERERAIEKLSEIYTGDYRLAEALKLAIESLKSEPRYLYDADTGKYKELTSGDCIDRKHLLNEIADLMESPWFDRGKDDLGSALHYGYVERKEAVEIVRDLCVKAEPSITLTLDGVEIISTALYDKLIEQMAELERIKACGDCVSREAVLNTLDTMDAALDENRTVEAYKELLKECYKALPPVTPKQRWIPVSERLPEEDGAYLLYGKVIEDEENNIFIGDYDSCAEAFGYWQDYYDPSTLGYVDGELLKYASVTAWMPLPEPYNADMRGSEPK